MSSSEVDRIPTIRHRGLFIAQCKINNTFNARLLVDTGASLTTLSEDFASFSGLLQSSVLRTEPVITAQSMVASSIIRLDSLQVGGHIVDNVEAAIMPLPPQLRVQGLLGASFLKHFRVTFEYDSGVIILRRL